MSKPKRCPRCGETDLEMFTPDHSRKDKLAEYCVVCKCAKSKEWYDAHKDVVSRRRKARRNQT